MDVDTEHPGEDGGGQFGGEGEQCGGAVLPGPDPDLVETLADPVIAEGVSWAATGKQPGDVLGGSDLGFASAGRDELADECCQRLGKDDRRGADRDRDGVVVGVDAVGSELTDGGDLLRVEDQQPSGDRGPGWAGRHRGEVVGHLTTNLVSSASGSPFVSGHFAQRGSPYRSRLTTRRCWRQHTAGLSKQGEHPHRPPVRLPT